MKGSFRTSTSIRRTSRPTGRWRQSTGWQTRCSKRRAVKVLPPIRISFAAERPSIRPQASSTTRLLPTACGVATRVPKTVTTLITTDLQLERSAPDRFRARRTFHIPATDYINAARFARPKVHFVEVLHAASRHARRHLERLRRHRAGAVRSRVGNERHMAANEHLQRHQQRRTLPAMSWVIPDGADSDHPGNNDPTPAHRGLLASSTPSAPSSIGGPARSSSCGTTGAASTIPCRRPCRATIKAVRVSAYR